METGYKVRALARSSVLPDRITTNLEMLKATAFSDESQVPYLPVY